MIPVRLFEDPDVLEVQVDAPDEVRIVPEPPTTTKVLFLLMTPVRPFDVPDVLEVQVLPLSGEVRMVPDSPTVAKSPTPSCVTPLRLFVVPEVLLSHEVPSEEVRMVPVCPTAMKVLLP